MKKLLLVTDTWKLQVNGVATILSELVPLLPSQGLEVVVVHAGLFSRNIRFPFNREILLPLFPGRKMRYIFAKEKPDFIHIATEGTLGVSARTLCKKQGFQFTTCYHSNYPLYASHYAPFAKAMARRVVSLYMHWFHGAAQAVLVTTKSIQEQLTSEQYRSLVFWPLGINTHRFTRNTALVSKVSFPSPVFVYMGRVAKEKNIDEFLSADLPGTKLIIGDGPYRTELEERFGSDRTVFVGYKRGTDLVDWLSLGDVYVFPSRSETFGLSVVEALACGLPVAAHDAPGPRDIVTSGIDGYLDENIATAACACLALSRDDCRATALLYSSEKSAERFATIIKKYPVSATSEAQ